MGSRKRQHLCLCAPLGGAVVGEQFKAPGDKTPGEEELTGTNYESYEQVPHHERQCKWPIYRSTSVCEMRRKTATWKGLKIGTFNLLLKEPGLLRAMTYCWSGVGKRQDEPEYPIGAERKEASQDSWGPVKRTQEPTWRDSHWPEKLENLITSKNKNSFCKLVNKQ